MVMRPDNARVSARFTTSPYPADSMATNAFVHGDHQRPRRPSQRPTQIRREPPPPPTPVERSPTATGSAPESSAAMFLGRNYFHCPELDQRMKKYLVRLANETANHLIRDTLEPEHANLVWRPMATVKGIDILRGYEQSHHAAPDAAPQLKDATCLRGIAQVSASIEEFAMLFKLDTNRQLAEHGLLFNPDLLDMATLYSLVQPSGDHPRRYVGIKWCLVQSPTRFFRNRDFCYLECQKEFRDARGRRGWVRSMHSIKMPCCPTLEKSHGVVRASLYRCGLIAVETDKPGVLDTTYTIEMDLKGHFPEIFQPKFLSHRIAALASIDKYLQQQRLSSSPLLGDLDIPKTKLKGACHFCFREFSKFTKRFICRKCGEVVCKNCSDDWRLDVPVVGSMKVRICTVCSAEARTCHATPRQTVTFDLPPQMESDDEGSGKRGHFYGHGTGRVRRSNSMPEHDEYGESPFQRTAREPTRTMIRSAGSLEPLRSHQMEPSEYFARQQRLQQRAQHAVRPSQAHYRDSDFTSEIHDFRHHDIRGTADITALWTKEDADRYDPVQRTRVESSHNRRASNGSHLRRVSTARKSDAQDGQNFRTRIPSDVSGRSVFRESVLPEVNYGQDGHYPPSARYMVVGDRLERSNSFDAGRQFEEQQHRQPQHDQYPQNDYQGSPNVHYGNSRRSQRPINGSYSPDGGFLQSNPSTPSSIYHYSQNSESLSSHDNGQFRPSQRQTDNRQPTRQQQAPKVAPAVRNVALEFARQPQSHSTAPTQPRNVALEFARQPQQPESNTTPRNIALEFLKQSQAPPNGQAPRNVALEFLKQQSQPSQPQENPAFNFGGAKVPWAQMQADQPEPPLSPVSHEPVEYVETDSGEWIASDRWQKGVLNAPYMDLGDGEPLETRDCDTCGAKQYVHEGVVEATCDCDIDDELIRPSAQIGRDESRVSFRVEGDVFERNDSFIDPLRSQDVSFTGKIPASTDVDEVVPVLVDRLSRHSLRSSFHHT